MKKINRWMISTIVISGVSVIIISILTFFLMNQPAVEMPNGEQIEMPENGGRPNNGRGEGGASNFQGGPGTEQTTENSENSEDLT